MFFNMIRKIISQWAYYEGIIKHLSSRKPAQTRPTNRMTDQPTNWWMDTYREVTLPKKENIENISKYVMKKKEWNLRNKWKFWFFWF